MFHISNNSHIQADVIIFPFGDPSALDYKAINEALEKENWYYDEHHGDCIQLSDGSYKSTNVMKSVWLGLWGLDKEKPSWEELNQKVKESGYDFSIETSYGDYTNMYAEQYWYCSKEIELMIKMRNIIYRRLDRQKDACKKGNYNLRHGAWCALIEDRLKDLVDGSISQTTIGTTLKFFKENTHIFQGICPSIFVNNEKLVLRWEWLDRDLRVYIKEDKVDLRYCINGTIHIVETLYQFRDLLYSYHIKDKSGSTYMYSLRFQ